MSTLLFLLMACGEPPATPTQDQAAAEQATPTSGPQGTPATPSTGQPDPALAAADQETRGVPVLAHRPEDADTKGKVVIVTGTLANSQLAQVRMMALGEGGQAEIFDLRAGMDGRFFAEAPAQWDDPVYISAVEVDPENPASVATGWGAAAEPIRLQGQDVHVGFAIGQHPDWTQGVFPPLDQVIDAEPLNAARETQEPSQAPQ